MRIRNKTCSWGTLLLFLFAGVHWASAQDTLLYQGWEGEPGSNGLYGFQQYNNQHWSQQNVWARTGADGTFTGVNAGGGATFRLLNASPVECRDSRLDSCVVAESAAFTGRNGAHVITGAKNAFNHARINERHTGYHAGPWCPQPFGCQGNTAASRVGLYSPKIKNNSGYSQLQLEFWMKVNGELNRDYGLVRYTTRRDAPVGPIANDSVRTEAPDDYWTTLDYADNSIVELAIPQRSLQGDTLRFLPLKPEGSIIPGQLQGYVVPQGYPNAGRPVWVKIRLALPQHVVGDTNLRIGFWWVNDNNGFNRQTGFPALIVDDVALVGYRFGCSTLDEAVYCPNEQITVPFEIDRKFYDQHIRGFDSELRAEISDSTGSFARPRVLGRILTDQLTVGADLVTGVIVGRIPRSSPQLPIGGYRVRIVGSTSRRISSLSPTVVTILPLPDYKITPKESVVCPGTPVTFTVEGVANSYKWYNDGLLVGTGYEPTFKSRNRGNFWAEVSLNGCIALTDTAVVVHHDSPVVSLEIPDDVDTVCYLRVVQPMAGGSPEGGTYFWYYERNEAGQPTGDTVRYEGDRFDSFLAGVGIHRIGYYITDERTGCTSMAFDTIVVLESPVAGILPGDTVLLCDENPVTLEPDREAASYLWSTGATTRSITVSEPGIYWLELIGENGCRYRTNGIFVFRVNPVPSKPTVLPLTRGERIVRGNATPGPVPPTHLYVYLNNTEVGWSRVNGDGSWSFTLPRALEPGDKITARIIYDTNCDGEVSLGVDRFSDYSDPQYVPGRVEIFNGFSPNDDGQNDRWVIVEDLPFRYPNADLRVFNRWGQVVYESKAYQNDWDGTNNGEDVPVGTYYYVLDLKDGSDVYKGYLTISR